MTVVHVVSPVKPPPAAADANQGGDEATSQSPPLDERYSLDATTWGLPHPPAAAVRSGDPSALSQNDDHRPSTTTTTTTTPTLTVLVCADIDIDSSSSLVDYTLQQQYKKKKNDDDDNNDMVLDASLIDVIVAVGPFCQPNDLERYMVAPAAAAAGASAQRRRQQRQQRRQNRQGRAAPANGDDNDDVVVDDDDDDDDDLLLLLPFLRHPEESCALEGLVTSALAQLENIVCRVIYIPGTIDPLTMVQNPTQRLTSNSRNVHRQSLPVVPGLAVAGLWHMEGLEQAVERVLQQDEGPAAGVVATAATMSSSLSPPAAAAAAPAVVVPAPVVSYEHFGEVDDEEEEDEDDTENSDQSLSSDAAMERLSDQLRTLYIRDYESTLDRLLELSSHTSDLVPATAAMTTLLVTHYVDSRPKSTASRSGETGSSVPAFSPFPAQSDHDPWPTGHAEWLKSRAASVCLEVAAGGGGSTTNRNKEPSYDPVSRLLVPGSLRQSGCFSIVTLTASGDRMRWSVASVEQHRVPEHARR